MDFLEAFKINRAKLLAEEEQRLAELNSRQKSKVNLGGGFNTFRAKTSTVSTYKSNTIIILWYLNMIKAYLLFGKLCFKLLP